MSSQNATVQVSAGFPGPLAVLSDTENYGGYPTFCALLVIIVLGKWKVRHDYKSLIPVMVYFDATGLFLNWITPFFVDMTVCQSNWMWLAGDLLFVIKDGLRCGYLIWKTVAVTGYIPRQYIHVTVWTAILISFALYHAFIWTSYNFVGDCQGLSHPQAFQVVQIVLYLYWLSIDAFTATCMITFLRGHIKKMSTIKVSQKAGKQTMIARVLSREIWRICWAALLGTITSSCAIAEFVLQTKVLYLRGSIMCISHFILVLSVVDARGDDDGSSTSSQGGQPGTVSVTARDTTANRDTAVNRA
ncbi:uncharacterized protein BJ171DRAFT_596210 [Polychytrium aggregatum]|uniref:uncharacterized protein n=1 Tax=Polychytrium aggregatum TaxID=110093 RepID=UPI0022FE3DD1|nr:uncharacterized protein BJ171DRAFT_596210 [Polychytrium aggregatum]KAI9207768.1 hypothetical protein BJ171DRAFT_596210 [Polychytrium aggregatum]